MATISPAAPHLRLDAASKDLVEALAGALGSVIATWTFYPLDTLKTRLQARSAARRAASHSRSRANAPRHQASSTEGHSLATVGRRLLQTEGASALYRGVGVKTAHSVLQSFVYFYAFARLRGAAEGRLGKPLGVAATLAVGTLAGWCNVLITEPLDTVATARQTASQRVGKAGAGEGSKEDAPAPPPERLGLYRSLWVSLLLTCNPALQFTAFDQARRALLARRASGSVELSAMDAFVLGAASKALATTLTYPAIRAKVVLQTGGASSLLSAARGLAAAEGRGWLHRGLQAQLFKTVLVAALQLMIKEKSYRSAYYLVMRLEERRLRKR